MLLQTLAVAHDLRLPVYTSTACRCLNTDQIVLLMSRVQWDIRDVMSQHSYYVDVILQVRNANVLFFLRVRIVLLSRHSLMFVIYFIVVLHWMWCHHCILLTGDGLKRIIRSKENCWPYSTQPRVKTRPIRPVWMCTRYWNWQVWKFHRMTAI